MYKDPCNRSFRPADHMNELHAAGKHPALTDQETGLPNRLHFDTVFGVFFATGSRGLALTVLLVEVDGFRGWAGSTDPDEVVRLLRLVGLTLTPVVRKTDLVARVGEARFAFCLLDCNLAGGVLVADRVDGLLDSIRNASGLGFSLGGAVFDPDMGSPADLLAAAESALRAAQDRGPNQLEFHR